uniref:Uncharacterized protein n=1 Tax=Arundo donax TaxID=35708 RepID=A0A0A9DEW1_ARUDO
MVTVVEEEEVVKELRSSTQQQHEVELGDATIAPPSPPSPSRVADQNSKRRPPTARRMAESPPNPNPRVRSHAPNRRREMRRGAIEGTWSLFPPPIPAGGRRDEEEQEHSGGASELWRRRNHRWRF